MQNGTFSRKPVRSNKRASVATNRQINIFQVLRSSLFQNTGAVAFHSHALASENGKFPHKLPEI